MPRTVPSALLAHLASGLATPAVLVLITRRDGVKVALTSAERDIEFNGDTYRASDGVSISALSTTASGGADALDAFGVLDDDRISEADIDAGVYDGAAVVVRLVNRNDLTMGSVALFAGLIGQIAVSEQGFQAEMLSLSSLLKQRVGDKTSPTCLCRALGDAQCKLNMGGNSLNGSAIRANRTISVVTDALNFRATDAAPSGHYTAGMVTMTSGPNVGIARDVKAHVNSSGVALIELRTPFPFEVSVGDTAQFEAGCDRTFERCDEYFGNANNFHGESDLPGNDVVGQIGRPPREGSGGWPGFYDGGNNGPNWG